MTSAVCLDCISPTKHTHHAAAATTAVAAGKEERRAGGRREEGVVVCSLHVEVEAEVEMVASRAGTFFTTAILCC